MTQSDEEKQANAWHALCVACSAQVPLGAQHCPACGAPAVSMREQLQPFSRAAIQKFLMGSANWWAENRRQYLVALVLQFSSPIPFLVYFWYYGTQFAETEWLARVEWFEHRGKYWLYGSFFVFAIGQIAFVIMFRRVFRLPNRRHQSKAQS